MIPIDIMDFHIRPATAQDLPQILEIYNAEILNGLANWNHYPQSLAELDRWFTELNRQQFPLFVAELMAESPEYGPLSHIAGYADYSAFR